MYYCAVKSHMTSHLCIFIYIRISTHGCMFIFRNPNKAQRAEISKDYPEVNWDEFGPAPEDGGNEFLEVFINMFCDNAKQTSFHTASGLDIAFKMFLSGRPWLNDNRVAFLQSDGANNYHDPTTELDISLIGSRAYSEPGHGKADIDSNCAANKRNIKSCRNRGFFQQNARQYYKSAQEKIVPGNTNCVVEIDASQEEKADKDRVAFAGVRNFAVFNIDQEKETITFWENFDAEASELSIANNGKAVGFGNGLTISIEEFNKNHRTHSSKLGGTLVDPDKAEFEELVAGDITLPTRFHKTKQERDALKKQKEEKIKEKAAIAQEKKAEKERIETIQDLNQTYKCDRCDGEFLGFDRLCRHISNQKCIDKKEALLQKQQNQDISTVLLRADENLRKENKARNDHLGFVKVIIPPLPANQVLGLTMHGNEVEKVEEGSLAYLMGQIDVGFILREVDGNEFIGEDTSIDPTFDKERTFLFKRPTPPIPPRGFARKDFQKIPNFKYHEEQLRYLNEQYDECKATGIRSTTLFETMKSKFRYDIREDNNAPMWLYEHQIHSWLVSKKAEEKKKKIAEEHNEKEVTKQKKKTTEEPDGPPVKKKKQQNTQSSTTSKKKQRRRT